MIKWHEIPLLQLTSLYYNLLRFHIIYYKSSSM
nr:MAG TPA: hypothetical protein [Caudoviricetes sp.]